MTSIHQPNRISSIDAYRGFVMLLMMAEVVPLARGPEHWPNSQLATFLAFHQSHVPWIGCSLHDLIQPSFSFLVGTAMMFSLARRRAEGRSPAGTWLHAIVRSVMLIALGIFLRSVGASQTNFTFEDTLSQIGLGYFFLYLVAPLSPKGQIASLVGVLGGYWLAFLLYPAPAADFDWQAAGVAADWAHHQTGIAAHWNLNSNLAWAFDTWFMNLFPREAPFAFNEGGYSTLSFIPTLGTMILGLMAGRVLQNTDFTHRQKLISLAKHAVLCWLLGLAWHFLGQCPIVKRVWTPSWALYSGGTCFALMAAFYALLDARNAKSPAWVFPLLVVGANSIVAYFIAHLWPEFLRGTLNTHFGWLMRRVPTNWVAYIEGIFILLCLWWFLFVLWRRRWFVRV